jgi:hypothetical protein
MLKRINPKLLLVVLIGAWVVVFAYRIFSHDEPKRAPLTYRKGQSAVVLKGQSTVVLKDSSAKGVKEAFSRGKGGGDLMVKLELLDQKPSAPGENPKNIFQPLRFVPPKPPAPPPTIPSAAPPTPPPPPPPPTPEEIAAEQARKDLSEFHYLGFLNRAGKEQAFLSRSGTLFNAKNGDVITGTFLLKELNSNFVIIQETGTKIEVTLPLTGS